MKRTERGFDVWEFTDRSGKKCSIQKSSLADEDCIWLGIHDLAGRMHLTRAQVRKLLPYLKRFAATGNLAAPKKRKK